MKFASGRIVGWFLRRRNQKWNRRPADGDGEDHRNTAEVDGADVADGHQVVCSSDAASADAVSVRKTLRHGSIRRIQISRVDCDMS